jgi:hypothetical protein
MKIFLSLVFAAAIMGLCVANGTVQGNEHPTSEHSSAEHSKADVSHEEHPES